MLTQNSSAIFFGRGYKGTTFRNRTHIVSRGAPRRGAVPILPSSQPLLGKEPLFLNRGILLLLPASPPACLPACLPASLPAGLPPAPAPACLPAHVPACLHQLYQAKGPPAAATSARSWPWGLLRLLHQPAATKPSCTRPWGLLLPLRQPMSSPTISGQGASCCCYISPFMAMGPPAATTPA